MNTANEEPKATESMESPKPQLACCGTGCGCHSTGASGKARWAIGAIILLVAAVLVARAMTKNDQAVTRPPAFASPVVAPAVTPAVPAESTPTVSPAVVTTPADAGSGTTIGAFAELNTVAAKSDAVFVYLLGKDETSASAAATKAMQAAVRTIEAKGSKCALFTLQADSPDYDQLAAQVSLPGVLALVKGKGMDAVSGEITETKLVQSYVAALSAGGCGSGGCGLASGGCK
jgi:MYXO-CTERM domain-containing protein